MTFKQLQAHLVESGVFSDDQARRVVHGCERSSLGTAIAVAFLLGIKLTGTDVDKLIATVCKAAIARARRRGK